MESGEVHDQEQVPYGVRVTFHVVDRSGAFEAETVGKNCFRLEDGTIATVRPSGDRFDVVLEAFESREEAESYGRRLADALLWASVPTRVHVVLEEGSFVVNVPEDSDLDRPGADLPHEDYPHYSEGSVVVFDRRHEESGRVRLPMRAEMSSRAVLQGQTFPVCVADFMDRHEAMDSASRLAFEVYSGSAHHGTERARFVTMVSALEPLVEPLPYSDVVDSEETAHKMDEVLEQMREVVDNSGLPEPRKNRWRSQIGDKLAKESITLALKRMVRDRTAGSEVVENIEDARGIEIVEVLSKGYHVRSRILHGNDKADIDHDFKYDVQASIEAVLGASVDAETFRKHRRVDRGRGLPTLP